MTLLLLGITRSITITTTPKLCERNSTRGKGTIGRDKEKGINGKTKVELDIEDQVLFIIGVIFIFGIILFLGLFSFLAWFSFWVKVNVFSLV